MSVEIKKLDEVLLPKYLGAKRTIVECNTERLTAPGENYGSLMLALDIKTKSRENGKEDVLHLVAKAVPPNEFVQKVFKSPITFKKELEFYRTIVPTLREFQKNQGISKVIDSCPDFYGGRLGLGPNCDSFDNEAVILLENIKRYGYECADRTKGFDLETAKFILKDLATFHAVPIALKIKKPELFKENVMPFLDDINTFVGLGEETIKHLIEEMVQLASLNSECVPLLNSIRNRLTEAYELLKNPTPTPREPFATLAHCDFWVNNIMIKTEGNKVISNKIVDFQVVQYGSPVKDLIFFIFDSVQNDIVVKQYDHLVRFYHEYFIAVLKQFEIDTEAFSLDAFENEIKLSVREAIFFHCLVMLKPIFAEKESVREVENLNENDMRENFVISQSLKEKLWMIVTEFAKKNWLK